MEWLKHKPKSYVVFLLLVSHKEVHDHCNGVDLMQELTLNVAHSGKIQQQPKVLR